MVKGMISQGIIEHYWVNGRITALSEKCSGEVMRLNHLYDLPTSENFAGLQYQLASGD
jgi:hypothetical protein